MSLVVVFIGPPGAGKSTQAALLSRKCGIPHLEMGEFLRQLSTQDNAIAREVKSYVDRGLLVPESIVKRIVADCLKTPEFQRGFIIDGFPRNMSQAKTFDSMLAAVHKKVDVAVLFEVSEPVAVERLSGRRQCVGCGTSYHVTFEPPRTEDLCDRCGGRLYQRPDDRPDVVRERLRVFAKETAPLISLYEERRILRRIDASLPVDQVFAALSSVVQCT